MKRFDDALLSSNIAVVNKRIYAMALTPQPV